MADRPNILYLHSHDTGRWISPYGHAVPTPRLQRLAEEGVTFRRAFCASPTCSASRACLLTGSSCHSAGNGVMGLANRGFPLQDMGHHLVHTLRCAGYTSHLLGFQHVAVDKHDIGYDRVYDPPSINAKDLGPFAADWVTKQSGSDRPWFASVGFFETHRSGNWGHTFQQTGDAGQLLGDPRWKAPPMPMPDRPELRQEWADFCESARWLDRGIGQVLDALEQSGQAENTLVLYTTDHGIAFPRMKCNLTDGGIGVALLMRGPGGFEGGREIDALVSHVDVFPTLCDLLEIDRPAWLEGTSFLPVVRDGAPGREAVFAETNVHGAVELARAIRTDRFKLIRRFDHALAPATVTVHRNCDDSPSKAYWLDRGWSEQRWDALQLYDLDFDPLEMRNLADDPAFAAVRRDLERRLDRWMRETDDPVLTGRFRLPKGALINDVSGEYFLKIEDQLEPSPRPAGQKETAIASR